MGMSGRNVNRLEGKRIGANWLVLLRGNFRHFGTFTRAESNAFRYYIKDLGSWRQADPANAYVSATLVS